MQDLEHILTKFQNIVSPNFCKNLAISTGLIKRSSSQLSGYEFAQALVVPNGFLESESLNSLAARMKRINPECDLSAPALAQRINSEGAETFMKKCFFEVLREVVRKPTSKLGDLKKYNKFARILIEDSTMIELNEKLSSIFKGRGGAASKAALKINYVFDYLSDQTIEVEFTSGNTPDQKLAGRIINNLVENDLIIRDLGYFVLKKFKEIEEKKAFYVSRFKSNVDVYADIDSMEPIDLAKFIDKHMYNGITDIEVFLGKERYPVRLVACLMSEDAVNKRKRDANRTAQRCGRQISAKKSNLLKYSIFITNVPAKDLSSTDIMAIYRVRWSIELIFKQWKSCLKLHVFKGYKEERIRCLLYGRLIMILLIGSINSLLIKHAFEINRELSSYKLMKYFIADHIFATAIKEGKVEPFISYLHEGIPRRICMDKRKKRLSLRKNAREGVSYYKN